MSATPLVLWGKPYVFDRVPTFKFGILAASGLLAFAWVMYTSTFLKIHKISEVAQNIKHECRYEYLQKETLSHRLFVHWNGNGKQFTFSNRRRMDIVILLMMLALYMIVFSLGIVIAFGFIRNFKENIKRNILFLVIYASILTTTIGFNKENKNMIPNDSIDAANAANARKDEDTTFKTQLTYMSLVTLLVSSLFLVSREELLANSEYKIYFFAMVVILLVLFIFLPIFSKYAIRFNNKWSVDYSEKLQTANSLITKLSSSSVTTDANTRTSIQDYFVKNAQRFYLSRDDPFRQDQYRLIEDAEEQYQYVMHRETKEDELPFLDDQQELFNKYPAIFTKLKSNYAIGEFATQSYGLLKGAATFGLDDNAQTLNYFRENMYRVYTYVILASDGDAKKAIKIMDTLLLKAEVVKPEAPKNQPTNEAEVAAAARAKADWDVKAEAAAKTAVASKVAAVAAIAQLQSKFTDVIGKSVLLADVKARLSDMYIRFIVVCVANIDYQMEVVDVMEIFKSNMESGLKDFSANDTLATLMTNMDAYLDAVGLPAIIATNQVYVQSLRQVMREFRVLDDENTQMMRKYTKRMMFIILISFVPMFYFIFHKFYNRTLPVKK